MKMNIIWSRYMQGTNTLYYSRKLRFDVLQYDSGEKQWDTNVSIIMVLRGQKNGCIKSC
jgi:hypothetical protein